MSLSVVISGCNCSYFLQNNCRQRVMLESYVFIITSDYSVLFYSFPNLISELDENNKSLVVKTLSFIISENGGPQT